tara:strand:- start:504 stop:800 length:297 start_codon:yes stop_codon:yes gene_type:complete
MTNDDNSARMRTDEPLAVALRYGDRSAALATVTASGKGALAERILQLAFAHGVKVRTDSDLAQILSEIEVDCPIPHEAFAAVSEILAYLYRCQEKTPD